MSSPRPAVLASLAVITGAWPQIRVERPTVAAWSLALAHLTDEQIRLGTALVLRYHTHGAPAPAHVIEMIRGLERRMPIYERDCWGRIILRPSGERAVREWMVTRVPIWEARGDPPPAGCEVESARLALRGSPVPWARLDPASTASTASTEMSYGCSPEA